MKKILLIPILLLSFAGLKSQDISICELEYKDSSYFLEGRPYTGNVISYYKNGNVEMKGQIAEGKLDSICFYFKKNGKIELIQAYSKGIHNYSYYHSSPRMIPFDITDCTYYEFYRDLSIKKEGYYLNKEPYGIWKEYYSDGKLKSEIEYVDGYEKCPYYEWDKDGRKYEINYGMVVNEYGKVTMARSKKTKTLIE